MSADAGRRAPVDPRLLRRARSARTGIAALAAVGLAQGLVTVGVVVALATSVVAVVAQRSVPAGTLAALAGLLLARAALAGAEQVLAVRAGSRVVAELRTRLLDAALDHGPAWVARFGAHRLATLAGPGLDALRPWFTGYLPALVTAAVLPALVVTVLALVDPLSALVVVLTLPFLPLFAVLVGWATQRRAADRHDADVRLAGHFLDAVRGLATLRLFGRAERQVREVAELTAAHRAATMRVLRLAFWSSTSLDLVGTLSVGIVAVEAGLRVAAGELALGPALLVILLAPEAYRPVREVGARFHAAADAGAVVEDVDAVLRGRTGDRLRENGTADASEAGGGPLVRVRGLRVRHPGRDVDALHLPALDAAPGEVVVLRGPSGAGKTTALRVLAGVQDHGSGTAHVAGPVLFLPQAPTLPHARTVADVVSPAELAAVGLDLAPGTLLGDGGRGLSAGQRHRLALARVLAEAARTPSVVLLDEPTAHLDATAETTVVAALRAVAAAGGAVVAVAHRPALVEAADRVVDVVAPVPLARRRTAVPPAPQRDPEPVRPRSRPVRAWVPVALGTGAALAGVTLTAAATWLLVRASSMPPVLTLSAAVVLVRGSAVARPLLRLLERLAAHEVAFARLARWRAAVYASLVPRVPGPASVQDRRGTLLTRVGRDVDARVDGLLRGTLPAVSAALVLGLAALVAGIVVPAAGAALAAGAVLSALVAPAVAVGLRARTLRRTARAAEELADAVTETVEAVEDLAARPRGQALAGPLRLGAALSRAELRQAWGAGAGTALAHTGSAVMLLGVLAAVLAGTVGPEVSAVLVLAVTALSDPALSFVDPALARRDAAAARDRLDALSQSRIAAVPADRTGRPGDGVVVRSLVAGWAGPPSLDGLDLTVPAGGRVAVTGASGSGKSTLAAVLVGFLGARGGAVRVGGRVGLVSGDAGHVFATTLRENLRLAAPGADDAHLVAVLHAARLGGWLDALPQGLDTWLGEGGSTLSGGEARRLLLARALLADPDVLVLDEPTEGLDEATAELLVADLLDAAAGRTVLLLTHRREGLDRVDAVLHLDGGRLRPAATARSAA